MPSQQPLPASGKGQASGVDQEDGADQRQGRRKKAWTSMGTTLGHCPALSCSTQTPRTPCVRPGMCVGNALLPAGGAAGPSPCHCCPQPAPVGAPRSLLSLWLASQGQLYSSLGPDPFKTPLCRQGLLPPHCGPRRRTEVPSCPPHWKGFPTHCDGEKPVNSVSLPVGHKPQENHSS